MRTWASVCLTKRFIRNDQKIPSTMTVSDFCQECSHRRGDHSNSILKWRHWTMMHDRQRDAENAQSPHVYIKGMSMILLIHHFARMIIHF